MELLLGLFLYLFSCLNVSLDIIVFSNHGGRQVDTAPPAIECLEDIIKVVDARAEGTFILMIIFSII